jgi:hypothetical protein
LGSGMNNTVSALAVSGTNLYAGGDFTNAGGATANYTARGLVCYLRFGEQLEIPSEQ